MDNDVGDDSDYRENLVESSIDRENIKLTSSSRENVKITKNSEMIEKFHETKVMLRATLDSNLIRAGRSNYLEESANIDFAALDDEGTEHLPF